MITIFITYMFMSAVRVGLEKAGCTPKYSRFQQNFTINFLKMKKAIEWLVAGLVSMSKKLS